MTKITSVYDEGGEYEHSITIEQESDGEAIMEVTDEDGLVGYVTASDVEALANGEIRR